MVACLKSDIFARNQVRPYLPRHRLHAPFLSELAAVPQASLRGEKAAGIQGRGERREGDKEKGREGEREVRREEKEMQRRKFA